MSNDKCDNGSKTLDCLIKASECILGIQDCAGLTQHKVFILTRTWTGERPGDGTAKEVLDQIKPSPTIVDYSHNLRLTEGGAIRQGDIILQNISKKNYPNEADIDCSTAKKNVEKYYFINDRQYTVIHIKDQPITWDIHLRKRSDETRGGK